MLTARSVSRLIELGQKIFEGAKRMDAIQSVGMTQGVPDTRMNGGSRDLDEASRRGCHYGFFSGIKRIHGPENV